MLANRYARRLVPCFAFGLLVAPAVAVADEPLVTIDPRAPWLLVPQSSLDAPRDFAQLEGLIDQEAPERPEVIRRGDIVFTADAIAPGALGDAGSLRSVSHPRTPGVLFLAFEGLHITNQCPGDGEGNSAKNCTILVTGEGEIPAWGNDASRDQVVQQVATIFADYDIVVTRDRPPPYMPYTMAMVGGSSQAFPSVAGACGVARFTCDAGERNVSNLIFPETCGAVAHTIAHESAHNWGLEHVSSTSDLLYPTQSGSSQLVDQCLSIAKSESNIACGHIHEAYCPEGGGTTQSSHREFLEAFGHREVDTQAPTIVSIEPADGTTITTEDTALVTASIDENSTYLAVRWTWLEGMPAEFEDDGYTTCTNGTCTTGYPDWRDPADPWDMLTLDRPPKGTYTFRLEATDAYMNTTTEEITVHVVEPGEEPPDDGNDDGDPDDGDPDDGGDDGDDGSDPDADGDGDGVGSGEDTGCACSSTSVPEGLAATLWAALVPVLVRRRRRTG